MNVCRSLDSFASTAAGPWSVVHGQWSCTVAKDQVDASEDDASIELKAVDAPDADVALGGWSSG